MHCAYVLLVDTPRLECPARVSTHLLRHTDPQTDVVVLTPPRLTLNVPGAIVRRVQRTAFVGQGSWRNTFMKLRAVELTEYDRVMIVDLDLLPITSARHLFAYAPVHTIAAARAYWLGQPFLVSGGPLVMRPNSVLRKRLAPALDGPIKRKYPGEMDWVNEEFGRDAVYLDGFETLLNGEFVPGDGVFGYWGRRLELNASETLRRATFVHCIAGWKPWVAHPVATSPEMRRIYDVWDTAKQEVCVRTAKKEGGGL